MMPIISRKTSTPSGSNFGVHFSTPNTGSYTFAFPTEFHKGDYSYRWQVPERLPLGKYKLHLSSKGGKIKDVSDRAFEIVLPKVDLVCGFMYVGKVSKKKTYILSGSKKKYLKFEVYVKNSGTKILNRVPIIWALLKQPGNVVMEQGEAGFGNVYPERMYTTTFEFKYSSVEHTWIFVDREKKLEKGDYSFVFEADPRNELRESEVTRANNKCEINVKIE